MHRGYGIEENTIAMPKYDNREPDAIKLHIEFDRDI